jgi:hypothetical protein
VYGGLSNNIVPDPKAVGPLGFGTANEPWVLRRKVRRPLNTQAIYTDAFNAVCGVYLALGWNFAAGDEGENEEGVFRRKMWGPNMLTPLGPGESDTFLLFEILNTFREDASLGSHGDPEDICFAQIPMPLMNVAGLIYPAAAKTRSAEEKSKGEHAPTALADQIREALADLPANRKEAARLRSVMRTIAPPAKAPGEFRVDYRNRVAFWWEERKRMKFQFIESLREGFGGGNARAAKNLDELDKALGGDPFALRVLLCFGEITPSGIVDAAITWFQHAKVTSVKAVESLAGAGWTVKRMPGESDFGPSRPYDYYMVNCLEEPDLENYKGRFGGADAKISIASWHQRNRKIDELKEAALLAGMLNGSVDGREDRCVSAIFECVRRLVLDAVRESNLDRRLDVLADAICERRVGIEQARDLWTLLEELDKKKGVKYHYDPRVDLGEQISDDEEDVRAMVDVLPRWVRLGPWDGVWSEGIGLRLWESLREVMRGALNRASNLMGEREVELVNDVFKQESQQFAGGLPVAARNFLAGYRVRREKVLEETLNYLSAVEDYMKTLSPLHKCDVPFAYGYKDFGGIGDCQGLSKFNPLHSPGQTPNQLAAAMMAVLNRNAGSGDTSFWADAGVMVSENIFALLRAAFGYVTVAWLFQAVTSDAFADLALAQAARRIRLIEAAQSGVGEEEPAQPILNEVWAKRHQLHGSALGEGGLAVPAGLGRLMPKVESEIELRQLREYLETSQAFITKDWRGTNGSFADPEVKSTVKLNLLQQLTPLTKDIGGYSFSPEDVESISFPTFEEARNAANIIVTRFQQTIDPKLGGLVVGMAKQQYQAMVLGAKGRITSGDIIRGEIANKLPEMRRTLAAVRAKRAEVAAWLDPFLRTRRDLGIVNDNIRAVLKEVLAETHGRVNDPQVLSEMLANALFEAERCGRLGGALTSECNYSLPSSHKDGVGGAARVNTGLAAKFQGLYAATESALRSRLKGTLSQRDEEIANKKDLKKRYDTQVWRSRQEILNLLSRRDQLANNTRLCLFCIDEAQGYVVFSSKGDSISEEKFLGEARAGCSVNVYCTQAPAAIKTAASQEQFQYFISNMRTQIVLGAPNEPDQKMLSDLWQGEEVVTQDGGGINVSYEGVERDVVTGQIRASKATSASRGYNTKTDFKKYVEGYQLRNVPTFRSWAAVFDGTTTHKPQMLAHVPYYLLTTDKVSAITGEPLCSKPFVSLLRDGEVSLPPLESVDVREMLFGLRQTGVDVDEDLEQAERLAALVGKEKEA